jgi:uncharacterized membrane protein HdeD (DUF308 family)
VDLGKGLACSNRCEVDVLILIAMTEETIKMAGAQSRILRMPSQATLISGIMLLMMGGVFLAWGLLSDPGTIFIPIMGGVFFLFGVLNLVRAFTLMKPPSRRSRR